MLAFTAITAVAVLLFGRMRDRLPAGRGSGTALRSGVAAARRNLRADGGAATRRLVDYLLTEEKNNVDSVFSVTGFNFAGHAQNAGFVVVKLKDWSRAAESLPVRRARWRRG